ncbi:hypothetical protein NLJ89_g11279 [Agrocybe chaxingu]|uniref:Uncharacterized protein n=1 Tax=Agrocybe chaxingu TaxID=84603 RepID=A0A9W8JWK7_9AGAR|nr:hypothetical protein NLJ89_g11279 [Agrocybe chaxingu]
MQDEPLSLRRLCPGFSNRTTPSFKNELALMFRPQDRQRVGVSCRVDVFVLGKMLLSPPPSLFEGFKLRSSHPGNRSHPFTQNTNEVLFFTASDSQPPSNDATKLSPALPLFDPSRNLDPPPLFTAAQALQIDAGFMLGNEPTLSPALPLFSQPSRMPALSSALDAQD